jgi:hypothetical protein
MVRTKFTKLNSFGFDRVVKNEENYGGEVVLKNTNRKE